MTAALVDTGTAGAQTSERLLDAAERLFTEPRDRHGVGAGGQRHGRRQRRRGPLPLRVEGAAGRHGAAAPNGRARAAAPGHARRPPRRPSPDMRAVVEALVVPLAELSADPAGSGRAYARVLATLHGGGPSPGRCSAPRHATVRAVRRRARPGASQASPEPVRHFRLHLVGTLVVQTLADRETAAAGLGLVSMDAPLEPDDHDRVVAALVDTVTGALAAPVAPIPKGSPRMTTTAPVTLQVDPIAGALGAEVRGVDLTRSRRAVGRAVRDLARAPRALLPRAVTRRRRARRPRPALRHAGDPPLHPEARRRAPRDRRDRHRRRRGRVLAHRRHLQPDAADGVDPADGREPAAWRRHDLHQPVPRVRDAVRPDARPARRAHRGAPRRAVRPPRDRTSRTPWCARIPTPGARRCSSTARSRRTSWSCSAPRATRCSSTSTRGRSSLASSAATVERGHRSASGTTAARSTTRSPTTRSVRLIERVTIVGDKPTGNPPRWGAFDGALSAYDLIDAQVSGAMPVDDRTTVQSG